MASSSTLICTNCKESLQPGDRFCVACGANVNPCVSCSQSLVAGDRFCASCGYAVDVSQLTSGGSAVSQTAGLDAWGPVVRRLKTATAGEFEIIREIGRGGMAAVYLARERALDRYVAMKVMSPALLAGLDMVERFQREARTVAKLVHPNIVTLHTVRQLDDLHFFTMQFVDGRSLDHIVRDAGPLPLAMVRGLLFTVGNALAHAHRRGVVHRDVKPANILVSIDGAAIVTDFGIAKVAEDSASAKTQTNAIIGTPAYISPEQCYGQPATAASDQYALGVVAFELLTGNPPFTGSAFVVMQSHTDKAVPSIRSLRADCPPELGAAIARMLAKEPNDRWPTIQHALAELGATPIVDGDATHHALMQLASPSPNGHGAAPAARSEPVAAQSATDMFRSDAPIGVASISILAPDALEVGDTITLSASPRTAAGTTMPGGRITWSSNDATIATIDAGRGTVQAVAPGEVTITASCEGVNRSIRLQVVARRVAAVNISMPPGAVRVGDRVRLVARAEDKTHNPVGERIHWTSGDAEIAAVTDSGVMTAHNAGAAPIWAEAQGVRGSTRVDVAPAAVASITLSSSIALLSVGESVRLAATPRDFQDQPLGDRVVAWESSDESVATIADGGLVEARRVGKARLTCTAEGKSAVVSLVVQPAKAAAMFIIGAPKTATVGEELSLSTQAIDSRGFSVEREIAWTVEPNGTVQFGRDGSARLMAPGTVIIRAKASDSEDTVVISVAAAAAPDLKPGSDDLARRAPRPPLAAAAPKMNANDERRSKFRIWALYLGVVGVAAASIGFLVLRSYSRNGDAHVKVDTPVISVTQTGAAPPLPAVPLPAPKAASITILSIPSHIAPGDAFTPSAVVRDARDSVLGDRALRWTSSVSDVAAVDAMTGHVTARKGGKTTLIATSDGISHQIALTVEKPSLVIAPASINITPVSEPLRVYHTIALSANTAGGAAGQSAPIVWTSGSPEIARVDSDGRVTGVAEGNATITARWQQVAATTRVTVIAAAAAAVVVNPPTAQMTEGEQVRLQAIVRDERNSALPGREISWHSELPDIAAVDNAGIVTGRRAGTTAITASVEGRTGRVAVTVNAKPVASPVVTPPATTNPSAAAVNPPPPDRATTDRVTSARIADFVAAINTRDVATLKPMASPNSWPQLESILKLEKRDLQAADAQGITARVSEASATVDFSTALTWQNQVRMRRSVVASCRATFALRNGAWALLGIEILNKLE